MQNVRRLDELVAAVEDKTGHIKDPALPYLGLEHFGQRGAGLTGSSKSSESISVNAIFKAGDVLFGKLRPNLRKCALAPFDGYCSTDVLVLRPRTDIAPRFAALVFQTERVGAQAERTAAGTKMPRTSWKELRALEVFCPDARSQLTIADVLDSLDTTIRQTEAIIEKLKQVKQGLLNDLLTRGIDANGELRPPQSQAPVFYKNSPLGWIPREWDLLRIEDMASEVTSGARDWARYYAESGAIFVRIGNLTREHINLRFDSLVAVRPPTAGEGQRTKLEAGDILISITADLGIVGVVPATLGEAYINQHIAMVRVDQQRANPRFLGHFLSGHAAQRHIANLNDSGAKAGLNLPTIRGLPVVAPAWSEQEGIARRLDSVDLRIAAGRIEQSKMAMLKSGLMDDLLTGRVRVTSLLT